MTPPNEGRPGATNTGAAATSKGAEVTSILPRRPDGAPDAHQLVSAVRVLLAAAIVALLLATVAVLGVAA